MQSAHPDILDRTSCARGLQPLHCADWNRAGKLIRDEPNQPSRLRQECRMMGDFVHQIAAPIQNAQARKQFCIWFSVKAVVFRSRMLLAQAISEKMTLVTTDKVLAGYGEPVLKV